MRASEWEERGIHGASTKGHQIGLGQAGACLDRHALKWHECRAPREAPLRWVAENSLDIGRGKQDISFMIPLEDNFNDVIGKAQRGLKLSDEQLAQKAGVSVADLGRVKDGQFEEKIVRKLAPVLNLGTNALAALGKK